MCFIKLSIAAGFASLITASAVFSQVATHVAPTLTEINLSGPKAWTFSCNIEWNISERIEEEQHEPCLQSIRLAV